MQGLKKEILKWGNNKNLLHYENRFKQFGKLLEEVNELYNAMVDNNQEEIIDSLGDIKVVITILAEQLGFDIDECEEIAYQEIKNRTGKTINGTFIKD
jgi:NTP pyrophosphatase (non-canonical NTP hydrolase)